MEPLPSEHADEVREIVKQEVGRALEILGDELAFQIGKLHQLSGPNTQRAINDAVFMASRKVGQS